MRAFTCGSIFDLPTKTDEPSAIRVTRISSSPSGAKAPIAARSTPSSAPASTISASGSSAAMSGTTSDRGAWPIVTMPIFALLIIPDGAPFTRPRPGEAGARLGCPQRLLRRQYSRVGGRPRRAHAGADVEPNPPDLHRLQLETPFDRQHIPHRLTLVHDVRDGGGDVVVDPARVVE